MSKMLILSEGYAPLATNSRGPIHLNDRVAYAKEDDVITGKVIGRYHPSERVLILTDDKTEEEINPEALFVI